MFFEAILSNTNENLRKECECDSLYWKRKMELFKNSIFHCKMDIIAYFISLLSFKLYIGGVGY